MSHILMVLGIQPHERNTMTGDIQVNINLFKKYLLGPKLICQELCSHVQCWGCREPDRFFLYLHGAYSPMRGTAINQGMAIWCDKNLPNKKRDYKYLMQHIAGTARLFLEAQRKSSEQELSDREEAGGRGWGCSVTQAENLNRGSG